MAVSWTSLLTIALSTVSFAALGLAMWCYRLLRTNQSLVQQLTLARDAAFLANHDPLTGLLNRRGWDAVVSETIRSLPTCTMALLDIDQFKQINDRYGHVVGDQVLVELSKRLRSHFTNTSIENIARIGGEEFSLVSHLTSESLRDQVLAFLESLKLEPIAVSGMLIPCRCSVGIAASQPGELPRECFARADQAMYRAKRGGSGGRAVEIWTRQTGD